MGTIERVIEGKHSAIVLGLAVLPAGIGFVEAQSTSTPWVAVGARGAVDFHLWEGLGLVVEGELQAPLVRARFVDDVTRQTLSEPTIVVGSFGVGLELQIL